MFIEMELDVLNDNILVIDNNDKKIINVNRYAIQNGMEHLLGRNVKDILPSYVTYDKLDRNTGYIYLRKEIVQMPKETGYKGHRVDARIIKTNINKKYSILTIIFVGAGGMNVDNSFMANLGHEFIIPMTSIY
jgi:hypothetical protein